MTLLKDLRHATKGKSRSRAVITKLETRDVVRQPAVMHDNFSWLSVFSETLPTVIYYISSLM